MEKEIKIGEFVYRIRKMNAIEFLALKEKMDFSSVETTERMFKNVLEKLEVHMNNDQWLPVKEKDQEIYYPAGIEDDIDTMNRLLQFGMEYIKSVFMRSLESTQG